MNLKELGESFRAERERMGLSIADVVQRTKISKTNIIALEEGDPSKLPHPVYAKGFVRNYAKLVGMNPEACADVMAGEFVVEDNVAAPQPPLDGPEQEIPLTGKGKSGVLVFVLGVLAIVLLAGVVYYMGSRDKAPKAEPAPAVEQSAAPAPGNAPEEVVREIAPDSGAATGQPGADGAAGQPAEPAAPTEPAAGNPDQSSIQTTPSGEALVQAAPEHEVAVPASNGGAAAQADGDTQRVSVSANEACWVFAKLDGGDETTGGTTVDIVLQPDQSRTLHFKKELVLRLGNAGGVGVTLNGKKYPLQAQSGQVKTLTFTAP